MAAYLAQEGFTGAADILEGKQGMAAGMSSDADPTRLVDGLGSRWARAETSFKWHASCRHTHPAADALLRVMQQYGLAPGDLARVVTRLPQGADSTAKCNGFQFNGRISRPINTSWGGR